MNSAESSDPIQSLQGVKRRHSMMLRATSTGASGKIPAEEILKFLEQGSQAGRYIASDSAREAAQGILDYWTSHLLSREPQRAAELGAYFLQEYSGPATGGEEVSSEEETAQELERLKGKAAEITTGMNPLEARGLRLTLLNLFKLSPGSRKPIVAPLPDAAQILKLSNVSKAVEQLVGAGLVRRDGEGSAAGYVLTRDELLTEWPLLHEIIEERRGFRDIASGWERGGRQSAALLNRGSQLEKAKDYQDLTDTERDFMEASKSFSDRLRKILLGAVSIVALGLAVGLVLLYMTYRDLKKKERELTEANKVLAERETELTEALRKEREARELAVDKNEESNQRLKIIERDSENLKTLARIAPEPQTLPEDVQKIVAQYKNPTASGDELFAGAMVEIFVSRDNLATIGDADKFLKALKDKGISIPSGKIQIRRRVADPTEVRCFHPEDEKLAKAVQQLIVDAGFTAPIQWKLTPDNSAPKRFIQISVAKDALK